MMFLASTFIKLILIKMKKYYLGLVFLVLCLKGFSQGNKIVFIPEKDDVDIYTFMDMMGFNYHKFEF